MVAGGVDVVGRAAVDREAGDDIGRVRIGRRAGVDDAVGRSLGGRGATAAGLLQATSLPFLVTVAQIGTATGRLSGINAAALVCAGLLSVLVFPAVALGVLGRSRPAPVPAQRAAADVETDVGTTPPGSAVVERPA